MVQVSSLLSIWHRFTGIFLSVLYILFSFLVYSVLHFSFHTKVSFVAMNFLTLNYYFYIIFVIFFTCHGFNGVGHILCGLGYLLDVNNVRSFFI